MLPSPPTDLASCPWKVCQDGTVTATPQWAGDGEEVDPSGQGVWQAAGGKILPGPGFSAPNWARRDPLGAFPLHGARGSNVAWADRCW